MAKVRTVTLTATTVEEVTLPINAGRVEVVNLDGAAEVYFTTDGSTPTVGGNDCVAMPAVIGGVEVADDSSVASTVVKLISSGTPKVSVRAL